MKVLVGVTQHRDSHMTRFLKALGLARGTTVNMMHVIEFPPFMNQYTSVADDWKRQASANAHKLISRVVAPLSRQGLTIRSLVEDGQPGPTLLDAVTRMGIDLTVVSPYRSSRLAKFLLGSVTELLLGEMRSSVLVVRKPRKELHGELTIVLAMDFSRDAKAAAKFLLRLRLPRKCRIILLHVEEAGETLLDRLSRLDTELPPAIEKAKRRRKRHTRFMLDRISGLLQQRGLLVDKMLAEGIPAEQILHIADRHRADLIVMGSKGLTGLERYLFGSVARKVARHALCSVLVVKGARRAQQ
jgi:nucleotide-binding universal stress UspA family protein